MTEGYRKLRLKRSVYFRLVPMWMNSRRFSNHLARNAIGVLTGLDRLSHVFISFLAYLLPPNGLSLRAQTRKAVKSRR